MPYKLVRDVILAKAKEQFGTAELYGSDRTKIVVNPSEETERLPWRYSYNLPTEEARIEEQERMDAFYRPIFEEIMRERFSDGKCAPFEKIYLATTNCCNGKCGFCPAGNDKSMRPVFLSSEILEKLISELCSCSFTGKISLHGVNEPLLDPRLEDICRMFKTRLPECRLQILTNGKLLTLDRLRNLLPVTDQIDIHVYDDRLSVPDRLKDIVSFCETDARAGSVVRVYLRREHEILSQKGYGPCGRSKFSDIKSGCIMPFTTLSVLADGSVSYCDSDYLGRGAMGNLAESSVMDIWNGEAFNRYRRDMLNGRALTAYCRHCDFF